MFEWLRFWKLFSRPSMRQPQAPSKTEPPAAGNPPVTPIDERIQVCENRPRGDAIQRNKPLSPATATQDDEQIEQERGLALLFRKLDAPSPTLHEPALEALVQLGTLAISPLIERLTHKDGRVRARAATALGRIGPPAHEALPVLLRASVDMLDEVRPKARKALEQIDPDWPSSDGILGVIPTLTTRLGDGKTPVAQAAAEVLTRMKRIGVPALISVLEDTDPLNESRRMWAARTLGWLGADAQNAVPALVQALNNEKTFVVEAILDALNRTGPAMASALPQLVEALRSEWSPIRQGGCAALGRMGSSAIQAVPALLRLLVDFQDAVSESAAKALLQIGPPARPALRRMVADRVEAVRLATEEAFHQVPELAFSVFHRELDRWDRIGRAKAARVLAQIDAESPEPDHESVTVEPIDLEARFCQARDEALKQIACRIVPLLVQRLGAKESSDRRKAAEALGAIGPPAHEAVPALVQALEDVSELVCLAAAEALFRITGTNPERVMGFRGPPLR
jgi:HEAT repeat protein